MVLLLIIQINKSLWLIFYLLLGSNMSQVLFTETYLPISVSYESIEIVLIKKYF